MKLEKETYIDNYYFDNLIGLDGKQDILVLATKDLFTNEERNFIAKKLGKKVKLTLEYQEPILDEEERKYLSGVIRPFRDRIECIIKKKSYDYDNREYIVIHAGTHETTPFPYFKAGTMYKNMVINKEYTLEELGL